MAQLVVYPSQDGCMRAGTDAHFSNARDAGSADAKYVSEDYLVVGLNKASASPVYRFYRSYLYFDTSSLPDSGITITSATLQLYQTGSPTIVAGGVDVFLMGGQPTYPSATLALADFDRTFYEGGLGSPVNVISGASGYITLTLSQVGLDAISATGTTKFCLMSGRDISYTIPWVNMYAEFYSVEKGTSYRPIFTINYSYKATITTQAASGETASSATGNGNITDLGDSSVTAHGMIYSVGADPVNLATAEGSTDEGAAGATGAFTSTMSGLSASTTYQCRAYATNTAGTSYGAAVEFTTSAPVAEFTVRTDDATNVAGVTATANGTIVEDAGYSITEHGFVYKRGSDPGTPADPTTAESYTEEGAGAEGGYTSSLAGLTESSTYYIRAYAQSTDDGGQLAYGDVSLFSTGYETEVTFDAESGSGYLYSGLYYEAIPHTASYACASAAGQSSAITAYTAATTISIFGRSAKLNEDWDWGYCHRGYLYFDTSSIPTDATIMSATLRIYITAHSSATWATSGLYVQDGMPTYPSESGGSPNLQLSDFQLALYASTVGSLADGSIAVSDWNEITISIASINKSGLTKYMVRHQTECASNWGSRTTAFYSQNQANYEPELVVEYWEESVLPTVPGINISDVWKTGERCLINIGDEWKDVVELKINIGDTWKDLTT